MPTVNYASKYSSVIDEAFKLASVTEARLNQTYDFIGVKTIKIYSRNTAEMQDYTISGTNRYGTPDELGNNEQELTLSKDRSFTFTLDRLAVESTMGTYEAGAALRSQIDQVVIPEVDLYRLNKYVSAATENGATDNTVPTSENAYELFLKAQEYLGDKKVPLTERVLYCTYAFYNLIKLDKAFVRNGDRSQEMLITGQIGTVDGVPVVPVPASYLEGANFVVTHKSVMLSPYKLQDYKIHDNPPGINGYLVEGRIVYDAFILNKKKDAIFANTKAA